ncbi:hypothetical protein [Streptomyces sp. SCL15-6]|uniref:hypothetical protein n=1 Tax=Streptomyces sp. SCL15-6 TaxID=2967222 RepID=UPI0029660FA2|nr:hypothetical protein [Streptomyces sp. SCL15-6]
MTVRITVPAPVTTTSAVTADVTATVADTAGTGAAAVVGGLGVYTVSVFMNTAPHSFDAYQPHHPLAIAARPDGTPLLLVFRASDRICSHEAAAEAAFTVGNRQGPDDTGQRWPADIRSVSVGDVVKVTGPDHWIVHLCVANLGCSPVAEPAHLTPLAGSRVTSRP